MLRHLSSLTSWRDTIVALALAAVTAGTLVTVAACRPSDAPVARLSVEPAFFHLAYARWTPVRVAWQIDRELPEPPIVFVHLLDAQGDVVRTFDHPFPAQWTVGTRVEEALPLFQSALAAPLPAGEYVLSMGLVTGDGSRWPLTGETVARREYLAARVDVPSADEAEPMFYFSNQFLGNETGTDVQYPALRWFQNDAVLRLTEVAQKGTVLLGLRIPGDETRGYVLDLEAGATQPNLFVTSPCSETQVQLTGAGRHVVRLPLDLSVALAASSAAAESAQPRPVGCEIRIVSNFLLRPEAPGGVPRVAVMEMLAWAASGSDGAP